MTMGAADFSSIRGSADFEKSRRGETLVHISNRYGALRNKEHELYARLHELLDETDTVREQIQEVGRDMVIEYAKWKREHHGE